MPPTPQQVFPVLLWNGKSFLQSKFLAVGSSLGHLSMKTFSDWTTDLTFKLDNGGCWVVAITPPPIEQKFTYFTNNEDENHSLKILVRSKIGSR